jgi:uncharacterized membrane protein YtjA (UPF0391 family)
MSIASVRMRAAPDIPKHAPPQPNQPSWLRSGRSPDGGTMLRWAVIFLVIAIVAGILGFAGLMIAAAGIAKMLFYLFLILFLITLISGLVNRNKV